MSNKRKTKYNQTNKLRRLFSLNEGVAKEFARVCKEKKLNMSKVIETLIHSFLCEHTTNGAE